MGIDKSKDKLRAFVKLEVTNMFQQTLDFVQVACNPETYPALRAKILRVGNDCIRTIGSEIEKSYDIAYVPSKEDIITFSQDGTG